MSVPANVGAGLTSGLFLRLLRGGDRRRVLNRKDIGSRLASISNRRLCFSVIVVVVIVVLFPKVLIKSGSRFFVYGGCEYHHVLVLFLGFAILRKLISTS